MKHNIIILHFNSEKEAQQPQLLAITSIGFCVNEPKFQYIIQEPPLKQKSNVSKQANKHEKERQNTLPFR